MSGMKIFLLLLTSHLTQAQLFKPAGSQGESSFMSKIANWFMPFGDNVQSASSEAKKYYAGSFMPLPKAADSIMDKSCNPCNKVPWIPVLANYGQNAIVGFVKPDPSAAQYLPPSDNHNPIQRVQVVGMKPPPLLNAHDSWRIPISYKPQFKPSNPLLPHINYGPPFRPPKPIYGSPSLKPDYRTPSKPNINIKQNSLYPFNSKPFHNKINDAFPSEDLRVPSFANRNPNFNHFKSPVQNKFSSSVLKYRASVDPIDMKPPPPQQEYDIPKVNLPIEGPPSAPGYPPLNQPPPDYLLPQEPKANVQYPQESQEINVVITKNEEVRVETTPKYTKLEDSQAEQYHESQNSNNPYQNSNNQYQNGNNPYQKSNNQYQNGNNQYQNSNDQYQNGNNQYQNNNDQYQNGNNQYQNGNNQYQKSNDQYQNGNNQYQNNNDQYQNGNNQYPNGNNQYQNTNNQYQNGNNQYQNNDEESLSSEASKFTLYVPLAEQELLKLKTEKERFIQKIKPLEPEIFNSQEVTPNSYGAPPSGGGGEVGGGGTAYISDLEFAAESKQTESLHAVPNQPNQIFSTSSQRNKETGNRYTFTPRDYSSPAAINNFFSSGGQFTGRQHQSGTSNSFNNFFKPLPFPQLSVTPVAPLHSQSNFTNGIRTQPQENQGEINSKENIQVLPSVQVASYLSTIEHPVTLIQSSVIDINTTSSDSKNQNNVALSKNNTSNSTRQVKSHNFIESFSIKPIPIEDKFNRNQENLKLLSNHQQTPVDIVNINYLLSDLFLKNNHNNSDNSNNQVTASNSKNETSIFKPPPIDYSNWIPTFNYHQRLSPSIKPPSVNSNNQNPWLLSNGDNRIQNLHKMPTKQTKIPYISKSPTPFKSKEKTSLPATTKVNPMSSLLLKESVWTQYAKDFNQEGSQNVRTELKTEKPYIPINTEPSISTEYIDSKHQDENPQNKIELPFDIIRLQKNIDDWTEQEFSNKFVDSQTLTAKSSILKAKTIPPNYLQFSRPESKEESIETSSIVSAPSKESEEVQLTRLEDEINNFIYDEDEITSTEVTTTDTEIDTVGEMPSSTSKPLWENLQVSISPLTKEKVYVVTPLPTHSNTTEENLSEKEASNGTFNVLKLLFSEWPHHINDLETTTSSGRYSKIDPLNLLKAEVHTNAPSLSVETLSGHSKVSVSNLPSTEPTTISVSSQEKTKS